MQAYYHDNKSGSENLPHKSSQPVTAERLSALGIKVWSIPVGNHESQLQAIARERGYKSIEGRQNDPLAQWKALGNNEGQVDQMKQFFAQERTMTNEIMFYVVNGGGFYDVRDPTNDSWIRIVATPGLTVTLPAGCYHRYILDDAVSAKGLHFDKDPSSTQPLPRNAEADKSAARLAYLNSLGLKA